MWVESSLEYIRGLEMREGPLRLLEVTELPRWFDPAHEITHERWGTFEVGETDEQREAVRLLRTAAIHLAAEVRELREKP